MQQLPESGGKRRKHKEFSVCWRPTGQVPLCAEELHFVILNSAPQGLEDDVALTVRLALVIS